MWFDRLLEGLLDTLLMVGVSSLIALLAGVPMAVLLVTSDKGGIFQAPVLNRVLGAFVNLFRSTPFLILMVALIPFTRLVVGTTYGVWAAVVPLTIAATPFFARIAEVSLREVDHGLVEAAQAMGCRRWNIVWHVLLPEALPGIVGGFTITLVTLINSSAMAGMAGRYMSMVSAPNALSAPSVRASCARRVRAIGWPARSPATPAGSCVFCT